MEIFAILLSIPVAFVANTLYCLFLSKRVAVEGSAGRVLRVSSRIVFALFVIEIILLIALGAVRSRAAFGPAFNAFHLSLFFLGPPALGSWLILRVRQRFFSKWYVATVLCTFFAFCLVLLQYGVSESLYGIDGVGGPYSSDTW
jgi:hypothetical protein